jgi:hypothetical protein
MAFKKYKKKSDFDGKRKEIKNEDNLAIDVNFNHEYEINVK